MLLPLRRNEGFIIITPTPSKTDDQISDSEDDLGDASQTITNTSSTRSGSAAIVENSGNNGNVVTATLPPGVSIASTGSASAQSKNQAQNSLVQSIRERETSADAEQGLIQQVESFINSLPSTSNIDVRTLTPTSVSTAPGQPIVVTGSSSLSTSQTEAFVIDLTRMPADAPTQLQLHNIDYTVIIGPAVITGGTGSNVVLADDYPQSIVLGADDDTLDGGGGNDTIGSAAGNDLLIGGQGRDLITGGADDDILKGGPQADSLIGGFGDDNLSGGQGRDTLRGSRGNDNLKGQKFNDLLHGGAGDDTLFGGQGKDILKGGEGADTFRLSKGKDTIKDFSIRDGDVIDAPKNFPLQIVQRGEHLLLRDNTLNIKTTILNISQNDLIQYQSDLI